MVCVPMCIFCVSVLCQYLPLYCVFVKYACDEEKLESQTSRGGRHGAKDKKEGPHGHSDTL